MDKVKELPECELEIVMVDGEVRVKATCQDDEAAISLKEILDNKPLTITVSAKPEIEKAITES